MAKNQELTGLSGLHRPLFRVCGAAGIGNPFPEALGSGQPAAASSHRHHHHCVRLFIRFLFLPMSQSQLESSASAGAAKCPLTSGMLVVGSSLRRSCWQQMGSLCCSCLHSVWLFLHIAAFFRYIYETLWASLKRRGTAFFYSGTVSNIHDGFLMSFRILKSRKR